MVTFATNIKHQRRDFVGSVAFLVKISTGAQFCYD